MKDHIFLTFRDPIPNYIFYLIFSTNYINFGANREGIIMCSKNSVQYKSIHNRDSELSDFNDENKWYALYVRSRQEKKVYDALVRSGIKAYLPLLKSVRQWADRKKKIKVPLFRGYVFVCIGFNSRLSVIRVDGAVNLVQFNGEPAPIPNDQILAVEQMLSGNCRIEQVHTFTEGEQVEVIAGPMIGLKGYLENRDQKARVVITVDAIGRSVAVELEPRFLKKIK